MQFDFNLGPNASQTIDVQGRFFKYKSGTGVIRVRTSLGGAVDLLPGQGVENVHFTSLTVSDRSGATNAGSILAGDFDFRDDRISGSVEVIDGGRNRTNAGLAFTAHMYAAANAGFGSQVQLYNPVDSGKNIVVEQIIAVVGGGYSLGMKMVNAQLGGASAGVTGSKKSGGPASAAQVWNSATQGAGLNAATFAMGNGACVKLAEPFVLLPGWGLNMGSIIMGIECGADVEYFEEPAAP